MAVSPDGSLLAMAGASGVVHIRELASGTLRRSIQAAPRFIWCVAFSPDGRTLAVGGNDAPVRLIDVASGWEVGSVPIEGRIRWVGFHPDGRSLAVAGWVAGSEVIIWDLARRIEKFRLKGHENEVLAGDWRADGLLLVTAGCVDGKVGLWDLSRNPPGSSMVRVVAPGVNWLHGVALTPEGRHLVTANPDGTMSILRLAGPGQAYDGRPDPSAPPAP